MIVGVNNIKIKICGNTEAENILALAELKPDMMGFVFYSKSKRCAKVEEIENELKSLSHIHKTGVFVNAAANEIVNHVRLLKLDSVQLHGDESPEFCARIKDQVTVIKALDGCSIYLDKLVGLYAGCVDYYLIDNKRKNYGGNGIKFEHAVLKTINFPHPFIVAGGIGPNDIENVKQLKSIPGFYGVDINSLFETKPGIKDIKRVEKFITHVR
jgi:phosphoribosylanthranilate isomerase